MAGVLTVANDVSLTGLGDTVTIAESKTMTVPTKHQEGYTVVGTGAAIQLFAMIDHIPLNKIYGIFLRSDSNSIFAQLDTTGTGNIVIADADLVLLANEACWIPINPGGNLGVVLDGDQATSACTWMIVGKA